MLVAG
jgi:hypothetical protein